jgi:hypothetical protein
MLQNSHFICMQYYIENIYWDLLFLSLLTKTGLPNSDSLSEYFDKLLDYRDFLSG